MEKSSPQQRQQSRQSGEASGEGSHENMGSTSAYTASGPVTEAARGNQPTLVNTEEVKPREAPISSAMRRGVT